MVSRLGRVRPDSTDLTNLATNVGSVSFVSVANVSAASATFRLLLSQGVSEPLDDESEALHWDNPVGAQETVYIEFPKPISLSTSARRLRVRSSVADALVFQAFG